MKKAMPLVLTIIFTLCFSVQAFSLEIHPNTVTIGNVDVIFDSNTSLTEEEMHEIAEIILNQSPNSKTYGLLCNLFGHNNTTEYATTITHSVNSTSPRCLQERWEIITCSRCGNTETTRLSYSYINCCPED